MRILILNPNSSSLMSERILESAKRYARSNTEIVLCNPIGAPEYIEGWILEYKSAYLGLEKLWDLREGFNAAIIASYGETGLYAARSALSIPVIGIAEASMLAALPLGSKFSILTLSRGVNPSIEIVTKIYGLSERCASIRSLNLTLDQVLKKESIVIERMVQVGQVTIDVDGAEVLILGGGAFAGFDKELEKILHIPTLDGVVCAVKLAEMYFDYGVSTSKVCSFKPFS